MIICARSVSAMFPRSCRWRRPRRVSSTRCRRISCSPVSFISRCPMRASFMRCAIRSTLACRASRSCSRMVSTLPTTWRNSAATIATMTRWCSIGICCCRQAASLTCATRTWSRILSPRLGASSNIAACNGTRAASISMAPNGRYVLRAQSPGAATDLPQLGRTRSALHAVSQAASRGVVWKGFRRMNPSG